VTRASVPFIEDMAEAYAWCDLIVCRGRADDCGSHGSRLGAILVPFPAAVDDHQTANARLLVMRRRHPIADADLTPARLHRRSSNSRANRSPLARHGAAWRAPPRPDATRDLAAACMAFAHARA